MMSEYTGSRRAEVNVETTHKPNVRQLFLSKSNIARLTKSIYNHHVNTGGKSTYNTFKQVIPKLAYEFSRSANMSMPYITDKLINNYLQRLKMANSAFVKKYKHMYRYVSKFDRHKPLLNPFRKKYAIGKSNEWENSVDIKRGDLLTPSDIRHLDVYQPYDINTGNTYRYINAIPMHEKSLYRRHYDKNPELTYSKSNSEKTGINRGYNMEQIYNTSIYANPWPKGYSRSYHPKNPLYIKTHNIPFPSK